MAVRPAQAGGGDRCRRVGRTVGRRPADPSTPSRRGARNNRPSAPSAPAAAAHRHGCAAGGRLRRCRLCPVAVAQSGNPDPGDGCHLSVRLCAGPGVDHRHADGPGAGGAGVARSADRGRDRQLPVHLVAPPDRHLGGWLLRQRGGVAVRPARQRPRRAVAGSRPVHHGDDRRFHPAEPCRRGRSDPRPVVNGRPAEPRQSSAPAPGRCLARAGHPLYRRRFRGLGAQHRGRLRVSGAGHRGFRHHSGRRQGTGDGLAPRHRAGLRRQRRRGGPLPAARSPGQPLCAADPSGAARRPLSHRRAGFVAGVGNRHPGLARFAVRAARHRWCLQHRRHPRPGPDSVGRGQFVDRALPYPRPTPTAFCWNAAPGPAPCCRCCATR